MKDNWTYKKLGEVSYYPNRRVAVSDLPEYSYVGVENLIKDKGGVSFSRTVPNIDSAIECLKNDILIGNIRPYLRKIWLADRNVGASGDIVVIRINPDFADKLNPNYLYAVLSSDSFFNYDNANTKGAKMPRGDRKVIANFVIPIPSLSEQLHIVSELNLLQGLISKQQVQLKELDNLAQAVFYDMFGDPMENEKGWSVKKLNEICLELFAGGDVPKDCYSQEKTTDFQTPIISNGIGERAIYGYTNKARVFDESITISGRGTIGYCEVRTEPYFPVVRLIVGVPNKKMVLPTFLKYVIDAHHLNGVGVAIPQLTIPMVKDINIILPPLPIQQSFNDKIKSIEKLKTAISKSIMETQKLYDYTTDKYFG
jgi:type I restriction enzyme S subunit